jgi:hypothetical protein
VGYAHFGEERGGGREECCEECPSDPAHGF